MSPEEPRTQSRINKPIKGEYHFMFKGLFNYSFNLHDVKSKTMDSSPERGQCTSRIIIAKMNVNI